MSRWSRHRALKNRTPVKPSTAEKERRASERQARLEQHLRLVSLHYDIDEMCAAPGAESFWDVHPRRTPPSLPDGTIDWDAYRPMQDSRVVPGRDDLIWLSFGRQDMVAVRNLIDDMEAEGLVGDVYEDGPRGGFGGWIAVRSAAERLTIDEEVRRRVGDVAVEPRDGIRPPGTAFPLERWTTRTPRSRTRTIKKTVTVPSPNPGEYETQKAEFAEIACTISMGGGRYMLPGRRGMIVDEVAHQKLRRRCSELIDYFNTNRPRKVVIEEQVTENYTTERSGFDSGSRWYMASRTSGNVEFLEARIAKLRTAQTLWWSENEPRIVNALVKPPESADERGRRLVEEDFEALLSTKSPPDRRDQVVMQIVELAISMDYSFARIRKSLKDKRAGLVGVTEDSLRSTYEMAITYRAQRRAGARREKTRRTKDQIQMAMMSDRRLNDRARMVLFYMLGLPGLVVWPGDRTLQSHVLLTPKMVTAAKKLLIECGYIFPVGRVAGPGSRWAQEYELLVPASWSKLTGANWDGANVSDPEGIHKPTRSLGREDIGSQLRSLAQYGIRPGFSFVLEGGVEPVSVFTLVSLRVRALRIKNTLVKLRLIDEARRQAKAVDARVRRERERYGAYLSRTNPDDFLAFLAKQAAKFQTVVEQERKLAA